MKKILLFLVLLASLKTFAQYPVKQRAGGDSTELFVTGTFKGKLVNGAFFDTTAANLTRISEYPYAQIAAGNELWLRNSTATEWLRVGIGTGTGPDTVFLADDLVLRGYTATGKQIIGRLHNDGIESGGIITSAGCLSIGVTPISYYIGGTHYASPSIVLTVPTPDATLPRTDRIVSDTNGLVFLIVGTPSLAATPPPYNPASQLSIATYTVAGGATCLSIGTIIIYDETGGTEYMPSTSGTISDNPANTDNPNHLTKADYVVTYDDSSQIIFTKTSGTDTVFNNSVFKWFQYINNPFHNQFQMQLFLGSTAVSSNLVVNPYFDILDTLEYQPVVVPWYAFGTSTSIEFDKIVFTLRGSDLNGASGFYLDYLQLQTGLISSAQSIYLTTDGTSGPSTLVGNHLNIPNYATGGGAGGGINIYNTDSLLAGNRIVGLNTYSLAISGVQSTYTFADGNLLFSHDDGAGNIAQMTENATNHTLLVNGATGYSASLNIDPDRVRIHTQTSPQESNLDTYADSIVLFNDPFLTPATRLSLRGDIHSIETISDSLVFDATTSTYTFKHVPIVSGTADSALVRDAVTGHLSYKKLPSAGGSGTVTTVTGTTPIVITSTPTTTPNVTITAMDATTAGYVAAGGSASKILHGDGTWKDTTAVSAGSSLTRQIITSGTTATVTGGNYIVTIDPAATIATFTLTLPASPTDMQTVQVDFGGTVTSGIIVTALTITPNSGQTILDNTPPGSATADNTLFYRYRTSNTTWYRFKP